MATALFAALAGKQVLLVERTGHVGGTTAWSAGTTWVPGTHHAAAVNPTDTVDEARKYLNNAIGERSPAALRQAFLQHGAAAVKTLEDRSSVKFRPYPKHPDYISELDGSTLCGRALEPLPFDGRLLGDLFPLLRPPIPEFTVLGGMMVDRTDINHLLGLSKSWVSLRHSVRILFRHALDRLNHPRGTRLVMGNALVGRLLHSLAGQHSVCLALNTSVAQLSQTGTGVDSVILHKGDVKRRVEVRGGVVLASGGFNRHPELRRTMLPGADPRWCPGAPGHTGEAHGLVRALGGHYGEGGLSHAFWAPVSLRARPDGSTAVFPHFVMDRAKPGMLAVNQAGLRFVNESTSYHLFALAMQTAHQVSPAIPCYLIGDAKAVYTYGMGMVRPGASPKDLAGFLADGYLWAGDTLDALASQLGIDSVGLIASVENMNRFAREGVDPEFQRGVTAYQHNIGDASAPGKNPNLGPIERAPFYAVRLYPGDIGAATGFVTDEHARVLRSSEESTGTAPIDGLYAVGNDMHSIMGGVYAAPGITIGPSVVFGYLAARHACARVDRVTTGCAGPSPFPSA
ncbi:MAG: hypothetical protein RLZZ126_1350 [Pseudomonadota bacterium]